MLYKLCRRLVCIVTGLLFKVKVKGLDKIPSEGPIVMCSNHISWWDPLVLACAMPRPIHFIAKKELFENKILALLFTKLHAFPVNRGRPDLGAIRKGLTLLKGGHVMGIFPEGTRQKTPDALGAGHGGAALFALRTGAYVVPVAIRGSYSFRQPVKIAFGDPVAVNPGTGKSSTDIQAGSKQVMEAIKALWETLESGKTA